MAQKRYQYHNTQAGLPNNQVDRVSMESNNYIGLHNKNTISSNDNSDMSNRMEGFDNDIAHDINSLKFNDRKDDLNSNQNQSLGSSGFNGADTAQTGGSFSNTTSFPSSRGFHTAQTGGSFSNTMSFPSSRGFHVSISSHQSNTSRSLDSMNSKPPSELGRSDSNNTVSKVDSSLGSTTCSSNRPCESNGLYVSSSNSNTQGCSTSSDSFSPRLEINLELNNSFYCSFAHEGDNSKRCGTSSNMDFNSYSKQHDSNSISVSSSLSKPESALKNSSLPKLNLQTEPSGEKNKTLLPASNVNNNFKSHLPISNLLTGLSPEATQTAKPCSFGDDTDNSSMPNYSASESDFSLGFLAPSSSIASGYSECNSLATSNFISIQNQQWNETGEFQPQTDSISARIGALSINSESDIGGKPLEDNSHLQDLQHLYHLRQHCQQHQQQQQQQQKQHQEKQQQQQHFQQQSDAMKNNTLQHDTTPLDVFGLSQPCYSGIKTDCERNQSIEALLKNTDYEVNSYPSHHNDRNPGDEYKTNSDLSQTATGTDSLDASSNLQRYNLTHKLERKSSVDQNDDQTKLKCYEMGNIINENENDNLLSPKITTDEELSANSFCNVPFDFKRMSSGYGSCGNFHDNNNVNCDSDDIINSNVLDSFSSSEKSKQYALIFSALDSTIEEMNHYKRQLSQCSNENNDNVFYDESENKSPDEGRNYILENVTIPDSVDTEKKMPMKNLSPENVTKADSIDTERKHQMTISYEENLTTAESVDSPRKMPMKNPTNATKAYSVGTERNLPTTNSSMVSLILGRSRSTEERNKVVRGYRIRAHSDALTIYDGLGEGLVMFSALMCVAPEDVKLFALPFLKQMKGWGLHGFLPERDLTLTGPYHENLARVLTERCNGKVIVVVSKDYPKSDECQFLTNFARQLDPASKQRSIIPVYIDKNIPDLPQVLSGLSSIRFNQAVKNGFLKDRITSALKPDTSGILPVL